MTTRISIVCTGMVFVAAVKAMSSTLNMAISALELWSTMTSATRRVRNRNILMRMAIVLIVLQILEALMDTAGALLLDAMRIVARLPIQNSNILPVAVYIHMLRGLVAGTIACVPLFAFRLAVLWTLSATVQYVAIAATQAVASKRNERSRSNDAFVHIPLPGIKAVRQAGGFCFLCTLHF